MTVATNPPAKSTPPAKATPPAAKPDGTHQHAEDPRLVDLVGTDPGTAPKADPKATAADPKRPVHTSELCAECGQSEIPADGPVHFACDHGHWDI